MFSSLVPAAVGFNIMTAAKIRTRRNLGGQRWATAFGVWVRGYGVYPLATKLGVVPHTVYHWVSGRAAPRYAMMMSIIGLSAGQLTINDLYAHISTVRGDKGGDANA